MFMKKSKHIQLILITAALASCNRVVIPQQQPEDITTDSTLTAPVANDSTYVDDYNGCGCDDFYPVMSNSTTAYGSFYINPVYNSYYYTGRRHRKGTVVRGSTVIVRGGFGKSSVTAGS
jgi:hypothetical protein